jgi:hypothetical protein
MGLQDKVFGNVLGYRLQGVTVQHPPCILGVLRFVDLAAVGRDPMLYRFLSPCLAIGNPLVIGEIRP